jgi:hypothetical protein
MMKVTYHLEHPNLQIFLSNSPTHLHWYWGRCGLCVDLLGVHHLFTTTYIKPRHLFKSIYHMILLYKLIVNYLSKMFEGCVFKWPKSLLFGKCFPNSFEEINLYNCLQETWFYNCFKFNNSQMKNLVSYFEMCWIWMVEFRKFFLPHDIVMPYI